MGDDKPSTGEWRKILSEKERAMAETQQSLAELLQIMRSDNQRTSDASLKQGAEVLAEVRAVKERVGEHAVLLGRLETQVAFQEKAINALSTQNQAQEQRLRLVEQKPEKPKVVEEAIEHLEAKFDKALAQLSKEVADTSKTVNESKVKIAAVVGGIVLIGGGLVESLAHYMIK